MIWQPIETAPKDGESFLVYMRAGSIEIVCYDLEFNKWWVDAFEPPQIHESWMEAWMPLPEPPK